MNLKQTLFACTDPIFKRLALEWFSKSGPFWEDDRRDNPNDYFHFEGEDVTDQGLGETARRRLDEIQASSYSFRAVNFERKSLIVQHGLPEDPLGAITVVNAWNLADLEEYPPTQEGSWGGMLETAQSRTNLLIFSTDVSQQLQQSPFNKGIANRILQLLQILGELANETQSNSSLTPSDLQLYQKHFVGEKAAFTDESDGNKREFKSELTFRDPTSSSFLFCPWHGKVKIGQFRIHFEWQRPQGQREIKVTYIGPKITKH